MLRGKYASGKIRRKNIFEIIFIFLAFVGFRHKTQKRRYNSEKRERERFRVCMRSYNHRHFFNVFILKPLWADFYSESLLYECIWECFPCLLCVFFLVFAGFGCGKLALCQSEKEYHQCQWTWKNLLRVVFFFFIFGVDRCVCEASVAWEIQRKRLTWITK